MKNILSYITPDMSHVNIFTHQNCLDGAVSAAILQYWLLGYLSNGEVTIHEVSYATVDEVFECVHSDSPYGLSVFTDMRPSRTVINRIVAESLDMHPRVLLVDHHASAIDLAQYPWALVDTRYAASLLIARLVSEIDPTMMQILPLAQLADEHDRWIHLTDASVNLALAFQSFGSEWIESMTRQLVAERFTLHELLSKRHVEYAVHNAQRHRDDAIKRAIEQTKIFDDHMGYVVAHSLATQFTSEVGEGLYRRFPRVDYVSLWNPIDGSVSLRSGMDQLGSLHMIAEQFGGGGHPHAAGYRDDGQWYIKYSQAKKEVD